MRIPTRWCPLMSKRTNISCRIVRWAEPWKAKVFPRSTTTTSITLISTVPVTRAPLRPVSPFNPDQSIIDWFVTGSSRSVSRFDFEGNHHHQNLLFQKKFSILFHTAQNDRPLPPIPYEELGLRKFPWYHEVERDQAERMLRLSSIDGAFLVRHSRRAGVENPYTLTLYYSGRIFHLNIRKRPDNLYALGKEKHKEKVSLELVSIVLDSHTVSLDLHLSCRTDSISQKRAHLCHIQR